MKRTAFRIAAGALIAGAIASPQLPALATARAAPTISIAAKSNMPKITGDVLVIWRNPAEKSATVKGTVSGASSGQDLRLYAQSFPFTKAPARKRKKMKTVVQAMIIGTVRRSQPAVATNIKLKHAVSSSPYAIMPSNNLKSLTK